MLLGSEELVKLLSGVSVNAVLVRHSHVLLHLAIVVHELEEVVVGGPEKLVLGSLDDGAVHLVARAERLLNGLAV